MDVAVHIRKSEVPEDVRDLAQAKVTRVIRRLAVIERADVTLGEDPHAPASANRVCEVKATGHGYTLRARAAAHDSLAAVDIVSRKLERQVERLKGKLIGRSHPRHQKHPAKAS